MCLLKTKGLIKTMNEILYKFNQKVINTPTDIAIESENEHITFSDIDASSEKIKSFLLSHNFSDIIGVYVENELKYLEILIGIFKANKIFLPMNLQLSQTKLQEKIDFHNITCVLTDYSNIVDNKIFYDISNFNITFKPEHNIDSNNTIAYILPTSGTTSSPKSVMVGYDNLHWILTNYYKIISFNKGDKFFFTASYTFDLFFSEILAPLYGNGQLFISKKYNSKMRIINLEKIINHHNITHLSMTPSMGKCAYSNIKGKIKSLKYLIWVGEKLENPFFNNFANKTSIDCNFYNMYGPTETTIYCTYQQLFRNTTLLPIGQAFDGSKLLILDEQGNPSNEGELLIGGKGLSKGYFNNNLLNSQKFIKINGDTYFKSGDLVSKIQNIFLYKCRLDDQIKINGARVELDEITEILSVALKKNNSSSTYSLTVYKNKIIIFIHSSTPDEFCFLEETFQNYPEYMRPLIIAVKHFIYTTNGKLDTEKLLQTYNPSFLSDNSLKCILKSEFDCTSIKELDSLKKMIFINILEEKFNIKLNICNIWDDSSLEREFNFCLSLKE